MNGFKNKSHVIGFYLLFVNGGPFQVAIWKVIIIFSAVFNKYHEMIQFQERNNPDYLQLCSLKYKQVTRWNLFDIRDPPTIYLIVFKIVNMVSYDKWFDALKTWNLVTLNNLFVSKQDNFNGFLVLVTKGNTGLTVGSRIFKHFIIPFCKGLTRF